jgi:very-short-patch-repair endonuclease
MTNDQEQQVARLAARQHGLVTRSQLADVGVSPQAVDRLVARGRYTWIHRSVYRAGPVVGPRAAELGAVLAIGRGARVSHLSAARLWGVVPGRSASSPVEVAVVGGGRTSRPGIRLHRVARLPDDECAAVDGVPVTGIPRTLVDLASRLGRRDLEQALARAERERLTTLDDVQAVADQYPLARGVPGLRAILDHTSGPALTDSEMEELFLALVREAASEIPEPRVNASAGPFRLDFYWPEFRIAVETDGYRHHGVRPRFEGDRQRTARLAAMGIQVIPVTWRQLTEERVATAVRIAKALVRAELR